MRIPKIFYSKLLMGLILVLLASLFALELKQWRQRRLINSEIALLVAEQKALEQKNQDLRQSLEYFSTDSYKEKLAREQLGLQKEGEIVVNFPKLAEQTQPSDSRDAGRNNPQKWWDYIFLKTGR